MKILMVCLGNICRSPLAEGILKNKLSEDYFVDSAGTIGFHEGEAPDKRSIDIAKKYGLDISSQKSRPIRKSDLENFDLVFCMDKNNFRDVMKLAEDSQKHKIKLILENEREVPDPYYGGSEGFDKVYRMLDEACEIISGKIRNSEL